MTLNTCYRKMEFNVQTKICLFVDIFISSSVKSKHILFAFLKLVLIPPHFIVVYLISLKLHLRNNRGGKERKKESHRQEQYEENQGRIKIWSRYRVAYRVIFSSTFYFKINYVKIVFIYA